MTQLRVHRVAKCVEAAMAKTKFEGMPIDREGMPIDREGMPIDREGMPLGREGMP